MASKRRGYRERIRTSDDGIEVELLIVLLVLAWIVSSGVFGLIGVVIGAPEIVLLLPPAFIGLGTVWGTVRWMNRGDDPRHVEPPSDAP